MDDKIEYFLQETYDYDESIRVTHKAVYTSERCDH